AATGLYTVVISNGVSVTAASANLAFGTTPVITAQPESQTVALGGTADLSVTATGEPSPHYQWFVNGRSIGGDGSALTIPGFDGGNAGIYFVVVSNSIGMTTSSNAQVVLNTLKLDTPSINAGGFQTGLTGAAGGTYILQTSVNLLNWTPLSTNYTSNGFLQLTDSNVSKVGYRFYRGVTN
ncbi:MAG TPA: immunoglobulin domain-containing protein, partial [Verrucomicrobiae bacterium]|nr:immunoglobulin domain-containing protein [Verrucomicrobiae bacterium]